MLVKKLKSQPGRLGVLRISDRKMAHAKALKIFETGLCKEQGLGAPLPRLWAENWPVETEEMSLTSLWELRM